MMWRPPRMSAHVGAVLLVMSADMTRLRSHFGVVGAVVCSTCPRRVLRCDENEREEGHERRPEYLHAMTSQ